MVLNCSSKKIAARVILPATEYVIQQIIKQIKVKKYGKTVKGIYNNVEISIIGSGMGAPVTAMVMEALKRTEVNYLIRLDYCGGLSEDMEIGGIVLCSEAICGDGTTPHYLNSDSQYPSIPANSNLTSLIKDELDKQEIDYHQGPIWSHDALFREPLELLEKARSQGAIAIDMETSVVFTLGELFNIPTASILIITDKPSGAGIEGEKLSMSPKIFQNLDRVAKIVLNVLSSLNGETNKKTD